MALYDAFISYSHTKDKPIAAALQSVIQKLGKPWYRRRALRLFRDDTSLSATPHLWPTIEQALGQSRHFLVLASPEAAASKWVNKEVSYWLDHNSVDTLLIGLTDGELAWDETAGDFSARADNPLPPALAKQFPSEPKWVDLRAYREGADKRDAKFTELAADFAAAIRGIPKEDLLSQEVRQQRRALMLAWSAAGALLVLAGLTGWQWSVAVTNERLATEQKQLAEQQRDRAVEAEQAGTQQTVVAEAQRAEAQHALSAATETANSLIGDLARRLETLTGIPTDLVKDMLDRAVALQQELAKSGPPNDDLKRSQAIAQAEIADTMLKRGDTAAAFAAADQSRQIMEVLWRANPTSVDRQQDLSTAYGTLGKILKDEGKLDQALADDRNALALISGIPTADTDLKLMDDLAKSYDQVALVLEAQGNSDSAFDAYKKAQDIATHLAAAQPDNVDRQFSLGIYHERIGNILLKRGSFAAALQEFQAKRDVDEKLSATDTSNSAWQRDLAVAHEKIAGVQEEQGQLDDALSNYRASVDIMQRLTAADSSNLDWQGDLARVYQEVGDVLDAQHKDSDALANYRSALALFEKLGKTNGDNPYWQGGVASTKQRIGDLLINENKIDEAYAQYSSNLATMERLAQVDPTNQGRQRDLAVANAKVGDALLRLGKKSEARGKYLASLTILERLSAAEPGHADLQRDVVMANWRLIELGDDPAARLTKILQILNALKAANVEFRDRDDMLSTAQAELAKMKKQ